MFVAEAVFSCCFLTVFSSTVGGRSGFLFLLLLLFVHFSSKGSSCELIDIQLFGLWSRELDGILKNLILRHDANWQDLCDP